MKILLVITIVVTVSSAKPGFLDDLADAFVGLFTSTSKVIHIAEAKYITDVKDFEDFKKKSDRKYWDSDDEAMHRGIFNVNNEFIKNHNERLARGEVGYSLDANFFADYRPSDLLQLFTGIRKSAEGDAKAKPFLRTEASPKLLRELPSTLDWTEQGGVTRIEYQGICRSGWAFAVTGAVEGHRYAKDRYLISLSKQELLACSTPYHNEGCEGGFQDYAFAYIAEHGISTEDDYPYVSFVDHECEVHKNTQGKYFIDGFKKIPPGDEAELQRVVGKLGPVACSMYMPEDFIFYKIGTYNNPKCQGSSPQQSILIVGYGENDDGKPLWLIKNSWSVAWGEYHYAQIPRNENFCGIALDCSYPVLRKG